MEIKRIIRLAACLVTLLGTVTFPGRLPGQELIQSEYLGEFSVEELRARYGPLAQYGVELYKLEYTTPDPFGLRDTASGLVVIPKLEGRLLPTLCYQHGTVGSKDDVPSNLRGGYQLAEVFASLGYFSVAPDFVGLGSSRGFHPYVHAATEASAAIDMLKAARVFANDAEILLNGQLFLTGYSQGGHASMALHRRLETLDDPDLQVTAAAHMAGPYSISGVMRDQMLSDEAYMFPAYVPYTILSYDYVYGLFDELEDYLLPKYANVVNFFVSGIMDLFTVNGLLISELTKDFGAPIPRRMLQDSVIARVEEDPEHPFNRALADNDVFNWGPQAPTRLFHCAGDDQVPFQNSVVAEAAMRQEGAPDLALVQLDEQGPLDHVACVEPAVLQAAIFFNQYQELPTSAGQPLARLGLEVGPNPASDLLRVRGLPMEARVSLVDLSGRRLWDRRVERAGIDIPVAGLAPGLYLLHVHSEVGQYVGKVVVGRR